MVAKVLLSFRDMHQNSCRFNYELMFKQENFLLEKLSKLWDYFYIKLPFHL